MNDLRPNTVTISFTGHRPQKVEHGWRDYSAWKNGSAVSVWSELEETLERRLYRIIEDHSPDTTFVLRSGLALGGDTVWARVITRAKREFPSHNVVFEAHVPCLGQESRWPSQDQELYRALLSSADGVILYAKSYNASCIRERNAGLIQNSDILFAFWAGKPSGTSQTVNQFKRANKAGTLFQIDPLNPTTISPLPFS